MCGNQICKIFLFWNQTILYTVESKETVQSTCWFNDVYQNWIVKAGLLYIGLYQQYNYNPSPSLWQWGVNFDKCWQQILMDDFQLVKVLLFFLFTRFSTYGTTGATGASRNFFSNFDFSYLCSLLPTHICVFTCINVFQSSLIYRRKSAHNFYARIFFPSKKSIIVEFLLLFQKTQK